ncbi:MAG: zf-TFIIB domain-containing protein [Cyanobacteria bacterium P01_F01_bin.116]
MPDPKTIEPRYNCPVCLGLPMQKLQITQKERGVFITLDYCKRCGGVWFDKDEVKLSQQIRSSKVRQYIIQKPRQWMIHCHECNTPMDRNSENCGNCGWRNQINCPVCKKQLQRKQRNHLTLDVCHSCEGVWFDQTELTSLWDQARPTNANDLPTDQEPEKQQLRANKNPSYSSGTYSEVNAIGEVVGHTIGEGSLDVVTQGGADLAQYMVHVTGNTIKGSAQVVSNAPEVAGGVTESLAEVAGTALNSVGELPELAIGMIEVTGEIAASMTEVLAEVLAGLFS